MAVMGSSGYEMPTGKKPSRDELIEHIECLVAEIERLRALLKVCRRALPQYEFGLIDAIDDAIGVNEQVTVGDK